jgi:uncharacterized protein (TIGR03083 family)
MDHDTIWRHIHAERSALARTLAELDDGQWQQESLCPGWTVHDVAAHVISTPQIGWREMFGIVGRNLGRGYNAMIYREVKRLGARETRESILADFVAYAGSTHHVPTTTSVEPLVDATVHHQDIVRPLGLRHEPDPEAAAVAADRCRLLRMSPASLRRGVRLVATDTDWQRGKGPVVEAPMVELLMLCSGRAADPTRLRGDAVELVRTT